jgi:hypothetical protein
MTRIDSGLATMPEARPTEGRKDNTATVIAIGLLAYASADVAHHVLGHGGACLALGGRLVSLSSIFVDCTVRGTVVDLAGPFGNLIVGLAALWGAMHTQVWNISAETVLFLALAAGFNLLWFMMQLVFSVATATDDFAWPMKEFQIGVPLRLCLIALGVVGYAVSIWCVAISVAGLALPRVRLSRIMWVCWLSAGAFACVTAMFDHHPVAAIVRHAAPQSFILAIGLLAVPAIPARPSAAVASSIGFSARWIVAAAVTVAASIVLLGPGFAISV